MTLVFLAPVPRRFADTEPDELAESVQSDETALRRAFLAAVRSMEPLIEAGVGSDVIRAMMAEFDSVLSERGRPILERTYLGGATFARDRLPRQASLSVSFDLVNPKAVAWADQHTGEMVTQVSSQTRKAIRATIRDALNDGASPEEVARRVRALIGLTERDALAVGRLRTELEESGRTGEQIDRQTARYAQRLLRRRAETIARHETMQAANRGQEGLWQQAVDDELLVASEWQRVWMIARDERTCKVCRPLDGKHAPMLSGSFPGGISGPPAHVICRCVTGLVRR